MWHVPVVACISAVAKAAALMCVVEGVERYSPGDARGWLLDRLQRYPPGYEGRLVACLERYAASGTDPRPVDADASLVASAPPLVPGTLRTFAADCYRVGGWLKRLAWQRHEWMLVKDLHDIGGRLGRYAETFGQEKPQV